MKHTYKSMLFAAMALAAGAAGYLGIHSGDGLRHLQIPAEQTSGASHGQIAGLSQANIEGIKEMIARQEYHISYDEVTNSLQSPNRMQNLRAYYKPGKLTVQNRVDSAGHNFRLHLINEGIYADGKKLFSPQSDATPTNTENKLLIDHKGFTEEFINTEDGVRQNFTVKTAPENTASIQVRLSARGLKAKNGGKNEIQFYRENAKGDFENYLSYSDLHCWDANKKPLAATLAYVNDRVEINVSVEGAEYPVTIDPIVANGNPNNVNKTLESEQSYAWLGYSVASAGDVNKDGYSDIIVGAPKYDWNGEDAGAAFVFPGSVTGVTLSAQRLNRNQPFAQMGYSVSSAGDVNKDGYSDVIVGSPYWEDSPAQNNEGAAFLYFGGPVNPQNAPTGINAGSWVVFQSDQAEANFGISVAMAGDVNADGYSDFMVGAHMYDKGQTNEGVAFLYYGLDNGLGYDPPKTEILESNQADAMFGYSLAGAGDINADGASDIVIGARLYDINANKTNEGAAFMFKGNINSTPVSASQPQVILMSQIATPQADARFGHTVSTAGDVNGDGYADIAIGAYYFDGGLNNEGAVYIHHGNASGVNSVADKVIEGEQFGAEFGWSVASAGDVNGDGYGDLLVGARYFDNGHLNEGAAFVYHGSSTGLNTTAASMIESNQGDAWLGFAVSSAGDVNGDGYSDILVGSYAFDHGQTDEGQVFVYHGSAGTVGPTAKGVSYSTASGALAGSSVSSAGDVNGDGLNDVIVGAPNYDGGQVGEGATFTSLGDAVTGTAGISKFETNESNAHVGCSVSEAGDIDGDGFDDVIIGAKGAVNGVNIGAAYIFRGSPQGLVSAVSQTLGFAANQGFGTSVSDAGDINRDGYDDVIVGLPSYSKANASLCGAVYVYLGSSNGLITPPTVLTSGLAGTQIGTSLDNAGDTNGDGYSDIVVGGSLASIGQNSEGAVFIWHGSSSGLPSNTVYTKLLQLDQANAEMGNSVAGAGDVNGDGYSDIIVGAHKYDNGQGDEGIAAVYYGSSTGIVSQIKTVLEANQSNAYFGRSVGGGIDVNGDGYDDVVVGAPEFDGQSPNGGGAWVFHGSMNGISTTSNFSVTSAQAESHMGESVSGAGDLNGDGYGDILVGIPGYDQSGVTNGGAAWAYFGNDGYAGKAKRSNLRLYNDDLTTIMNHEQDDEEDFGLGLAVTSFLGQNNGRLAWDLAKYGESFSKLANTPITNSTLTDGYENSFSSLSLVGGNMDLKEVINKPLPTYAALRVRGRIKYELATALTGQVFGPWRYLPGYVIYTPPISPNRENGVEEFETLADHNLKGEYKDLITVYPNPVAERLFIQSANMDQLASLQLISTNGTMAFTSAKPQSEVDVRHLAAGSYILVIHRKDGSKTSHKVLIKK
ncbi:FG-GAP-like repeat-containing protein [Dyadobacter sp. BHUBP1]|uniref:FG-GAP-like repeat-containing protein n=1 Tax=Dyadobacter sp. BHUBP1 TaxID=3424178 RepID=UPI003D3509FC